MRQLRIVWGGLSADGVNLHEGQRHDTAVNPRCFHTCLLCLFSLWRMHIVPARRVDGRRWEPSFTKTNNHGHTGLRLAPRVCMKS
jgi:hypothetical protein